MKDYLVVDLILQPMEVGVQLVLKVSLGQTSKPRMAYLPLQGLVRKLISQEDRKGLNTVMAPTKQLVTHKLILNKVIVMKVMTHQQTLSMPSRTFSNQNRDQREPLLSLIQS